MIENAGTPGATVEGDGLVLVHTGVELVRHGLTAMLDAIGAGTVRTPRCPSELRALVASAAEVTVILGLEDGDCAAVGALASECRDRGAAVLVLVGSADEEVLEDVTSIPSDGYLLQRELTTADLATAVDCVSRRQVYLPATLAGRLLASAREGQVGRRPAYGQLTPREREVVALLVDGMSNKQIAKALRISQHGVKRLVANVLAKLNCSNRTSAVSVALRENLVEPRPGAEEPAGAPRRAEHVTGAQRRVPATGALALAHR